ncbi:MAG: NAD-dependent succinate-semialdehyde dehydrogenase [Bacteroidia bacterium]
MDLNNPSLYKNKAFINGNWECATSNQVFDVINPYSNNVLAQVPNMHLAETKKAISAASMAFKTWRKLSAADRSKILRNWYNLQIENADDLAKILTLEQGKPITEAKAEILYGASFVEWFAEEAKRTYGDIIPGHGVDKRIMVLKQPVGVCAAITPWNFPNAMITRKVAPALAAGCTVVIKPAEATPLSALALAELAHQAGFPAGVFNVITTNQPHVVGAELSSNKLIKKVSFTGSTAVGKKLMTQCASTVKKLSLELGGNAPFIVFNDADIDAAVDGAIASKYRNAGQTCVCANRIYVQANVYNEFISKFTQKVSKLKVGNGINSDVIIGPMINQNAIKKVNDLVFDAKSKGATVLLGGKTSLVNKNFYEPTVLGNVNEQMKISSNEIFGPVAPIYKFNTESDVVKMANNTEYGLAAYFYGRDYALIWRVAEALEYGMVGINTGLISTAVAPFGGIKESGFGSEGSKYGIDEYLNLKYMCYGVVE